MANRYGPRIRAARGFAHLSQSELAARLGVEVQWVKRREAGSTPTKRKDRIVIAQACKVPLAFLELGWDAIDPEALIEDVIKDVTEGSENEDDEGPSQNPDEPDSPGEGSE